MSKPKIVVVGSSNTDMIVKSPHIPAPGETVLGGIFATAAGGKGANQAVAAARAGGEVVFVARVGDDMFGAQAIAGFEREGIDCSNFVQQIYKKNGIEIPDKPNEQRDSGKIIAERERKAGDLIYYDKANNGYGHIGIYVGNGFIINSTGHSGKIYPQGGVRIVRLLYPDRTSYQVVSYLQEE